MLDFKVTDDICKMIKTGKRDEALKMFYDPNYEEVSSYYYSVMKDKFSKERNVGLFISSWDVHNIADLDKVVGAVASSNMHGFAKKDFLSPILYSDKLTAFNEELFPVIEDIFDRGEMVRFKKHLALRNDNMETIVFRLDSCEENGYAVYPVDSSVFLNK